MLRAKNVNDISVEVEDVNAFFNRINDGFYNGRLSTYVTYKTTIALMAEERKVAELFQYDRHSSVEATKISDTCYVVTERRWRKENGEPVAEELYFPYWGQGKKTYTAYPTYELAAIAAFLCERFGENERWSQSLLNLITIGMDKEGK